MAGGITVALFADVKSYLTGIRKSEDATEELSDTLDDMAADAADAARDAGHDLAAGVGKGADDAADHVDKLERTFRDLADNVKKDTKHVGDQLGDDVKRGTDDASEGLREFESESASTAREAAASFDGSAESIADAFQEVAANAFAGFGPAGAVAGLAVAAGLGIAITKFQEAADAANQLTEDAAGFALSMRDADTNADRVALLRDRWDEVATKIADARQVWEVWQPRAITNIERFADAAESAGFDVAGLFDAFQDPDPVSRLQRLNGVLEDTRDRIASVKDEMESYQLGSDADARKDAEAQDALMRKRDALIASEQALSAEVDTARAAAAVTEALAAAAGQSAQEYQAAAAETERLAQVHDAYSAALEATADPVSTFEGLLSRKNDAMRASAEQTAASTKDESDSWEDYTEDVAVSTQDLIDEWNAQAEAAAAFETNLAIIASAGGQALADELRAKGPEVAGAVAEVIATSDPATQQAAIDAHAKATGGAMGTAVGDGLVDSKVYVQQALNMLAAGLTPPKVNVKLQVDTGDWDATVAELMRTQLSVPVGLGTRGGNVRV